MYSFCSAVFQAIADFYTASCPFFIWNSNLALYNPFLFARTDTLDVSEVWQKQLWDFITPFIIYLLWQNVISCNSHHKLTDSF